MLPCFSSLYASHVIPALIKKFMRAKSNGSPTVTVWGSGKASREFVYVANAAEGIVLAAEKYKKEEPAL
ncbi:MAG TPA: NAD-dependent epimerase/dehydratase family protein [Candidatus Wolfebacteria bacterium]|nr:NAD-dependent epimerase/dehydratase family protein [Candidatus Wolfebacteria bacterium]